MAQSTLIGPRDGEEVQMGGAGARFMLDGEATGGGFSMVEHPLEPRALGAPLHRHKNEDEYSYVTEGQVGVKLGEQIVIGRPGDLIVKPRGQWHTFWNAGDTPARLLEIISPPGFERYFAELSEILAGGAPPDEQRMGELLARYELEMDMASVPALCEEHGLRFGPD